MVTSAVRFIAAIAAATAAAGTTLPAQATSDALTNVAAPRWVDQTVYQPGCRNIERDCGCRSDSYREPDCGRW